MKIRQLLFGFAIALATISSAARAQVAPVISAAEAMPSLGAGVAGPTMATQPMHPGLMYGQPGPIWMAPGSPYLPMNYSTAATSMGMFGPEAQADLGPKWGGGGCGKGECDSCCGKNYCHKMVVFGEFMYLRARDAEVAVSVPIDGPITPNTPRVESGPVAVADQDFQPAFRVGAGWNTNECTQIAMEYAYLDSSSTVNQATTAPFVLLALVEHPSVRSAGSNYLQMNSRYDIRFDLIDVTMRRLFNEGPTHQLSWALGLRYAQHEQQLDANFTGTGRQNVSTDIDFYGMGVRGGLEYENYLSCQWYVYAKGYGSLLPGEFRASFQQEQSFDARVVNTDWKAGRIVTIWDLELGMGWTSKCRNYRLSGGYVFSAWTNMVQTDEWIKGVHTNNFIDMDATSTFDGLVARLEARF